MTQVQDFFAGKKLGLVLSGGGSRGFGHLGMLHYLEEQGISPCCIAASSAGALVGVCLAAGKSAKETGEYFLKHNLIRKSFTLSTKGILDTYKIVRQVLSFAGVKMFSELKIPLAVNAMDINTGKEKTFSSGKLLPALRATIALPLVCFPVQVGKQWYVDGSVMDVVPTHLLPPVDVAVAVDVSLPPGKVDRNANQLGVVTNMIIFSQRRNLIVDDSEDARFNCYIRIPLKGFSLLEYSEKKHKEMIEQGYRYGKRKLNEFVKKHI